MTAIAALLGALCGAAVVVAGAAWLGIATSGSVTEVWRRVALRVDRVTLRVTLAAVAGVAMAAVTGWPVAALLAALAGFVAPSLAGQQAARAAEIAKVEAIAGWAEMLRDTMAAAGGLEQSILATAPVAPPAIRDHVGLLATRIDRHQLEWALRRFADDLDDPTGDLVVAALLLAAQRSPGRLGHLLGNLAGAARAEVTMRLRVEAGRARVYASVRIITIFAVGFSLALLVLNRAYLVAYDDVLGQAVLGLVGGLYAAAYWWITRASHADRPGRFLSSTADGQVVGA